jgi:hypothetical protein
MSNPVVIIFCWIPVRLIDYLIKRSKMLPGWHKQLGVLLNYLCVWPIFYRYNDTDAFLTSTSLVFCEPGYQFLWRCCNYLNYKHATNFLFRHLAMNLSKSR